MEGEGLALDRKMNNMSSQKGKKEVRQDFNKGKCAGVEWEGQENSHLTACFLGC